MRDRRQFSELREKVSRKKIRIESLGQTQGLVQPILEMSLARKEVRTPELIGQIKNFMDKDRRVSIETISAQFDISVRTVHTIIREELKMRKICANFVPRVLREDQKERCCHDNREMVELINSDPAVLDALAMKAGSTAMTQRPRGRVPSGSMLARTSPRRPDRANPPRNFWYPFF